MSEPDSKDVHLMVEQENKVILQNLDNRVTGLERDVSHISQSMDNFIKDVHSSIRTLRDSINEISNINRPTISTILGGLFGLLVVLAAWSALLVGGIWWMNQQSIEPIKHDLEALITNVRFHVEDGHPYVVMSEVNTLKAISDSHIEEAKRQWQDIESKIRISKEELLDTIQEKTNDRWTGREDELVQKLNIDRHNFQEKQIELTKEALNDKMEAIIEMIKELHKMGDWKDISRE